MKITDVKLRFAKHYLFVQVYTAVYRYYRFVLYITKFSVFTAVSAHQIQQPVLEA